MEQVKQNVEHSCDIGQTSVAKQDLFLPHLRLTYDIGEAWPAMITARDALSLRDTPS